MQATPAISATGPAAFGVIAERFRRAGQPEKAATLCREGLEKFPDHLSARVTLGWSLLDMGEHQEAFDQLKNVLKRAPDNLAAIRGLAELHERGIGLVFESLSDPYPEFDPVMHSVIDPAMDSHTDLDPVIAAHEAPSLGPSHFALEDVVEHFALELELEPEPAPVIIRRPVSQFARAPLALRDDAQPERAGELNEWLSRIRERRFDSVSQLMAG